MISIFFFPLLFVFPFVFFVVINPAYSNGPSIYYRQTPAAAGNVKCVICYAQQDFLGGGLEV